jgi:hypothetical protein
MRALSPALARSWLDASITSEKADQRRQLLELMEPQLSLDDEPFLSGLLSDRSEKVRELAIQFLTRSPGSALSRRMCDRGAGILQRLGAGSEFSLACVPPETLPEDWESDGIRTASEEAGGRRAHWVRQIMAAIPLDFWTSHFHESPAAILEAIHKEQFADVILDGWRMATIRFAERDPGAQSWLRLLWDQAIRQLAEPGHPAEKTIAFLHAAATKLAPAELDVGLQLLIRSISEPMRLDAGPLFEALPAPWSVALSRSYLKFSRALFQSRIDHAADRWLATLLPAARGLAPESIPAALEPWIMSPDFRSSGRIEKVLQRFGEVIRLRRAFREEAERVARGHKPE